MILQWLKNLVVGPAVSPPFICFNCLEKGAGNNPPLNALGKVAPFPHLASAAPAWPIVVISLADQIHRRQGIIGQLEALGLPYTILDAVDGRNGLPAVCELLIDRKGTISAMRRRMSDAEYACAMSHMLIYRKVLDAELPGAIILEDDAELAPGFSEFVAAGAYKAADIVKLDYRRALVWKWWRIPICTGVAAYRITRNSGLLTGYTISARAAGRILKRGLPIRRHADWPIDITLLKSYVCHPRLVTPNDQPGSSLQGERSEIKRAMARRRPFLMRARDLLASAVSTELKRP